MVYVPQSSQDRVPFEMLEYEEKKKYLFNGNKIVYKHTFIVFDTEISNLRLFVRPPLKGQSHENEMAH